MLYKRKHVCTATRGAMYRCMPPRKALAAALLLSMVSTAVSWDLVSVENKHDEAVELTKQLLGHGHGVSLARAKGGEHRHPAPLPCCLLQASLTNVRPLLTTAGRKSGARPHIRHHCGEGGGPTHTGGGVRVLEGSSGRERRRRRGRGRRRGAAEC